MKKKLVAIVALAAVMTCSAVLGLMSAFAVQRDPVLQFTGVYMGGEDYTASNQTWPSKTTLWGNGLGLTFATNAYDIGQQNQETMQDIVTEVSDGEGGYLTNQELVTYESKNASNARTVEVIWHDAMGNLVFRLDNYADESALSALTDADTGLKFYAYGDGDRVTVKKGFTFPYNTGTEEKKLVLANDVTVEYSKAENDWHEVVEEGETAQINMRRAYDVEIAAPTTANTWGMRVNLFRGTSHPEPFTETATDNSAGRIKASARTDEAWSLRGYWINRLQFKYYTADGNEITSSAKDEIFYTESGVVIRPNQLTGGSEGDRLILKKGFREAYYYGGVNTDYGVALATDHTGVFQTVGMLAEDVTFVFTDGAWERAGTVDESVDFSDDIKALEKIYKGQSISIASYNLENVSEQPKFLTSDESVISVTENGVITGGDTAGKATISVLFANKTLVLELENLTGEPVITGVAAKVNAQYGAVVLYQGEANDAAGAARQITANYIYDNGFAGAAVALKAENIDFAGYDSTKLYDGTQATVQSVKIKAEGFETAVPVHVYPITETIAPPANQIHEWGGAVNLYFTNIPADTTKGVGSLSADQLKEIGQYDKVEVKAAAANGGKTYEVAQITYIYANQTAITLSGKAYSELVSGDTLTLKAGYCIYYLNQGAAIALSRLTEDCKFVWNGASWENFTAEATELELEKEEITLPVGGYYEVEYNVLPAHSYVNVTVISSDPETVAVRGGAITVLKASDDPVTITVMLGTDESTAKEFVVNAMELEVIGYQIYQPREYNVALNGTFELTTYMGSGDVPVKLQAVEDFGDGIIGAPFDLDETNTVIGELDTSEPGTKTVTLTIDKDGDGDEYKAFDTAVTVVVRDSAAQVPNGIMQEPFDQNYAVLYIDFSGTFRGAVNVPKSIVAAYRVADFIKFVRGEKEYPAKADINGQYLVIQPVFDDSVPAAQQRFQKGDRCVVSPGMPMIEWTGQDSNYAPVGAGDYVVAGTIEYETVFELHDEASKGWNTFIQYEDFTVESDEIDLGIGKLRDFGATMVPAYATVGEFTVQSSNPDVVSVNANNLVKGEKLGTATITITLDGGEKGPISKTVTVNVVDARTSIAFSTERVYVKTGTVLTGQVLKELGVTAQFVWASGKTEGEADLTSATVIGYSANQEGEQQVTLRLVVDGTSVTGKITVVVNATGSEPSSCGCNSSLGTSLFGAFVLLTAAAAALALKRGKEKN